MKMFDTCFFVHCKKVSIILETNNKPLKLFTDEWKHWDGWRAKALKLDGDILLK